MPLRPKPQSSPQHWSKDYVEHLRSVHFALLTVAVGLILLLTSKTYDPRAAAEQMDIVVKHDALWRLNGVFKETAESGEDTLLMPHEGEAVSLATGSFLATTSTTNQTVRFQLKGPALYICLEHRYESYEVPQSPHTLNAFQETWDGLEGGPFDVDSITSLTRIGKVNWIGPPSQPTTDDIVLRQSDRESGDTLTIVGNDDKAIIAAPNKGLRSVELSLEGRCGDTSKDGEPQLIGFSGFLRFAFGVAAVRRARLLQPESYSDPEYTVVRPSEYADRTKFPGERLSITLFSEKFRDLAEAGKGRMNEDFTTLAPEIRSESNKGDEAFDAFGIKFPSEQVTRWGIIVLIGVQLYFLMYLRRLSNKLEKDYPAWDVPWMAMDQSRLARAMLFASVLCLPIYAAFLVAVRAMADRPGEKVLSIVRSLHLALIKQNVWVLIGFVVSVSLSILCWTYRPKLKQPDVPPEALEDQGSGI